ncbi:sel1 repeat family protein [Oxalobacter vibrioformis]|uniref:Sel1 repeat family protein n=1 Tax=Oxalobacter vibrioformis TaxID=933080 RepID=A0A9E9LYH4_9BURK|nr:tetratricopeptide repeat protein [Oxalobacter vibrioformis]WAW09817.1 sel1 repeat family protein [Oxalobacter vibrioformis]
MRQRAVKRPALAGAIMLLAVAMFLPLSDADAQIRTRRPLSAIERDKLTRLVRDANEGYDVARYKLGTVYLEGKIVRQSYPDAVKWFAAAAEEGHVHSMLTLAMLYSRGQGVKADPVAAYGLVKKLADRGFRMAQYNLGMMLETGQGAAKDVKAARGWYDLAAKAGSPSAIHRLRFLDEFELTARMADPEKTCCASQAGAG